MWRPGSDTWFGIAGRIMGQSLGEAYSTQRNKMDKKTPLINGTNIKGKEAL